MRRVVLTGLTVVFGLSVCACDDVRERPPADEEPITASGFAAKCSACHGDSSTPAPPRALDGSTTTDQPGVGAHRVHLGVSAAHLPIACSACHSVPDDIYQDGHLDTAAESSPDGAPRAEVVFSGVALHNGATPTWDPAGLTCANTWCHAGKPTFGGRFNTPKWTVVDGSQRACDSCHGAPPSAPHPADPACETCHADLVGPGHTIIDRARHLDGKIDVRLAANVSCAACHGDPPATKHPKQDTCELCHAATVGPGRKLLAGGAHRNGKVDFALASQDCSTCHGAPPTKNDHPQMKTCSPCHSATVDTSGTLLAGGAHTNGVIDMQLPTACGACHGDDKGMPNTGAHTAHVKGKTHSGGGLQCDACHQLPDSVTTPGHLTGKLQTVTFPGGLGSYKGMNPAYDATAKTCANVYCHGGTLQGGAKTTPNWTDVDIGCDSCHGAPPPEYTGHPQAPTADGVKTCNKCHTQTVDADGKIRADTGAHINGWVDK